MAGITVGIDGSHNSRLALEWAMSEAVIRKVPLQVLTVNPVMASYWTGHPAPYPGDDERLAAVRKSAEDEVAGVTAKLASQPPAVTITAVNGFPAKELIDASAGADLLVVGTRGGGGFTPLMLGSVGSQVVHHAGCPVVVVPHSR